MSSFAVSAERLVVHKHPDPTVERIELAQVGEYRAVIPKGRYKTGDWAIHIPEQAIVPDDLLAELGLAGQLAGQKKNRVKAVARSGVLAQSVSRSGSSCGEREQRRLFAAPRYRQMGP